MAEKDDEIQVRAYLYKESNADISSSFSSETCILPRTCSLKRTTCLRPILEQPCTKRLNQLTTAERGAFNSLRSHGSVRTRKHHCGARAIVFLADIMNAAACEEK